MTNKLKFYQLTDMEKEIIEHRATEPAFTGEYDDFWQIGTYICRRCHAPLYLSKDKFNSGCGWASFDAEIKGAIRRSPDLDDLRLEITCSRCGAHLGHMFEGENFTVNNIRHCVNSLSIKFIPNKE